MAESAYPDKSEPAHQNPIENSFRPSKLPHLVSISNHVVVFYSGVLNPLKLRTLNENVVQTIDEVLFLTVFGHAEACAHLNCGGLGKVRVGSARDSYHPEVGAEGALHAGIIRAPVVEEFAI